MRYAIIKDGQVVNIAVSNGALSTDWIEVDHTVDITDMFDGKSFTKKTPSLEVKKVPYEVPMWKARAVLIKAGLMDKVNALFAGIPDPIARSLAASKFEFSLAIQRDDPLVELARTGIGLSHEDIDSLFIDAENYSDNQIFLVPQP